MNTGISTGPFCSICGKPFAYVGDVPVGGFLPGQEPYCTGHKEWQESLSPYDSNIKNWKYCPHCGKELK